MSNLRYRFGYHPITKKYIGLVYKSELGTFPDNSVDVEPVWFDGYLPHWSESRKQWENIKREDMPSEYRMNDQVLLLQKEINHLKTLVNSQSILIDTMMLRLDDDTHDLYLKLNVVMNNSEIHRKLLNDQIVRSESNIINSIYHSQNYMVDVLKPEKFSFKKFFMFWKNF